MKNGISVVIPTFNEQGSIEELIKRIHQSLSLENVEHEIIVIDDYSYDSTWNILENLKDNYPLIIEQKQGHRGKAFSLLQGFKKVHFDSVAMIDADLQYSPEAILPMYKKLNESVDVVVANRKYKNISPWRHLTHFVFKHFFGKILHGLDVDVQSGLKVFKYQVIEMLELNPSGWTFDLEFLLKARHIGYKIDSYPIVFEERLTGESKVKTFQTAKEIGSSAISIKLEPWSAMPHYNFSYLPVGSKGGHASSLKPEVNGFYYKGKEYVHHTALHPRFSALFTLTALQKLVLFFALGFTFFMLIFNWYWTIVFFISSMAILYLADLIHNFYLIYTSYKNKVELHVSKKELLKNKNREWPMYTIFCPLYKEAEVLSQFINAITSLEYPKEKLQVLLLLEEDDTETIDQAVQMNLPQYFEVVVVPNSQPKTKPKACNYGLKKATGEYCVIYDAEDIPDPLQLKKAVLAFEKSSDKVQCIQAKLNFYNPHQNLLTRLFTGEYTLWFDLILTGMQAVEAPIPLGGTSNHFLTKSLKKFNGWDAFNVTEDCDLGMRIAKLGYTTAIINSVTMEEANSHLGNWFNQRTRWVKGYIQTYFVHMRDFKKFFYIQIVVGGKVLSMLINPIMWILFISYFPLRAYIGDFIESLFPTPIFYISAFSLVIGNFLYFYNYMLAVSLRGKYSLVKYTFFVPFYWLAMSAAAWVSIYRLIRKPHHWSKTKHGLHLQNLAFNPAHS